MEAFHYTPTKRIPYLLFATQREFATQNVFQVTESVLGVTSPEDLKMTVPYFGDHARFVEVSTHEMVHQFTIQKLMDQSGGEDLASPIELLPLWYIEGIAEYYTKGGIDVETDQYLRDLVWNPDPRRGYEILPFAEDRLRGYIPTYKLGQARIAFIAEEYGREKIQGFLENAYLLGQDTPSHGPEAELDRGDGGASRGFAALVRRVLNEPLDQVDARWHAWLKRRYYAAYLDARQDLSSLRRVRGLPAEPEHASVSPDGQVALLRGIDREKGRARMYLLDLRAPRTAVELASDSVPGYESFHPIDYGTTAVGASSLAFSAQDGIGDRLYVQRFRHKAEQGKTPHFQMGKRRALDVRPPGGGTRFITIADPAFSPDEKEIAFVGVAADGQQDIYVAPARGTSVARRLTNDFFAKKDLAWGKAGIYYASDATDHGRLNLFLIDPATGAKQRLTTGPSSDRHPAPQPSGAVYFSSDADGKPDLWELQQGRVRRLTDFTTGLTNPALSARGRGLYAATFNSGYFRLVEVPRVVWLDQPWRDVAPAVGEPLPIPEVEVPLDKAVAYRATRLRNWKPETGFIYGGGSGGGVAGRAAVLFTDYLRDNLLYADVSVYGSLDYTQALILYENRAHRPGLVLGGFHYVQQQIDTLDLNLAYYQREFGLAAALRYPIDRFRRVELELSVGGIQRYCLTDFTGSTTLACGGIQIDSGGPYHGSTAAWNSANGGVNPTINPSLRFGEDTLRYDPLTGPLDGDSIVLELGGGYLPGRDAVHGFVRADLQHYWQLLGRSNFSLRFAGGTTFAANQNSKRWARDWWLTSADNLRGFYPGDVSYLIGQHYYVTNAELQLPLDPILRLAFFQYIEGVAAMDFGGVFNRTESRLAPNGEVLEPGAWDARTLTGVLGVNVLFGPLLVRVHFGHPFDIGGLETPALRSNSTWVTNVTLRWFFF
ncbi:MAG: hypothetical protein QM767_03060 [Anaeromyxobacter sp.]